MIKFEKFTLENGLTVLFHKDITSPMAVVNTLYDVGARDENPNRTGFAHLFEHLMFGGSVNIPNFDEPLQNAGGDSNAFTSNDITNYYNVIPGQNLETALWLESDRMRSLAFTPKSLEVQRSVVIEEFRQRYLNQPYGKVWLELRPLAYSTHPYQWATIGKDISHIEDATMEEVKTFFHKFYSPSNAILCIAGNFELKYIREMVQKWYGSIPGGEKPVRSLPAEPKQKQFKEKTITDNVPANAFYYAFKMPKRKDSNYYVVDLLSDVLGRDKSSRLYVCLKKELQLVSSISAYITGSIDHGLLIISGKLNDGVSFEQVDAALWELIEELHQNAIPPTEMQKLLVKFKTAKAFEEQAMLNRAMNLCAFELLGDANDINEEDAIYDAIRPEQIQAQAQAILQKTNCSLLKVKAK